MPMGLKSTNFWLAGTEGMDKKIKATVIGHIRITVRIHCFIPS